MGFPKKRNLDRGWVVGLSSIQFLFGFFDFFFNFAKPLTKDWYAHDIWRKFDDRLNNIERWSTYFCCLIPLTSRSGYDVYILKTATTTSIFARSSINLDTPTCFVAVYNYYVLILDIGLQCKVW